MSDYNLVYKLPQQIAEGILGRIKWETPTKGYCPCPGRSKHNSPSGRKDCCVMIDSDGGRTPTVHCFHGSCAGEIKGANFKLRSAFARKFLCYSNDLACGGASAGEEAKRQEQIRSDAELAQKAREQLSCILRDFVCDLSAIRSESPSSIPLSAEGQFGSFLELFDDDDVLWTGDIYASGREEHRDNFRPISQWRLLSHAPAPLFCPAAFRVGTFSRSKDQVIKRLLLAVEADSINPIIEEKMRRGDALTDQDKLRNKEMTAAVFRWLRDVIGLRLRAIVDSGNKSLHGFFDPPEPECFRQLKIVLPALKCDRQLFNEAQPARLAGGNRDGVLQELLYLDLNRKGGCDYAAAE